MEVICLETKALYSLIDEVVSRVRKKDSAKQDKWIQTLEVMELLGVKSKTTLQKLRDEGKIRYSQPFRKIILYDRESILEYLDSHAKEIF